REKASLRKYWGNWQKCKQLLPKRPMRILVEHLLHHPDDYGGALRCLRPELLSLYVSAYQRHLWKQVLARWLEANCPAEQFARIRLRLGEVPVHRQLEPAQLDKLEALLLPFPSARCKPDPGESRLPLVRAVLAAEGLELGQLQIKSFREMAFPKGERAALYRPAGLLHETAPDEFQPGQHNLVLSFELPRGCYATLLVKRITTWKP